MDNSVPVPLKRGAHRARRLVFNPSRRVFRLYGVRRKKSFFYKHCLFFHFYTPPFLIAEFCGKKYILYSNTQKIRKILFFEQIFGNFFIYSISFSKIFRYNLSLLPQLLRACRLRLSFRRRFRLPALNLLYSRQVLLRQGYVL